MKMECKLLLSMLAHVFMVGARKGTACTLDVKATTFFKYIDIGRQMRLGETCTILLQAPLKNQTLFFKLGSKGENVGLNQCWNYGLELYNGNVKPQRGADQRSYCVNGSGFNYWYRSKDSKMTIVFTKFNESDVVHASYRIDDCECQQGPSCQRPCTCKKGFWGLCHTRTCLAPSVKNVDKIVQMESTGLSDGRHYSIGSVISFSCMKGFRISGYNKLTCTPKGWFRIPPKCIASNFIQETFCKNKYLYPNFDPNLKYRTTMPPYKRIQALINKVEQRYRVNTKLIFKCTNGYFMENMYEMQVVEISCRDTGEWTIDPWPMCEEITCPTPSVQNAKVYIIEDDQLKVATHRVGVGTKLKYECEYGYYMKGDSELMCQKFKYYKEIVPECIDKDVFFKRCKRAGKLMKFNDGDSRTAFCAEEGVPNANSPVSLNTLTVVTAAAATVFGVLLLVIALVAYQRRRIIHEMRRLRHAREAASDEISVGQRQQANSCTFHFVLPSYDEAIRTAPSSAPPSFAEAIGDGIVASNNDSISLLHAISTSRQISSAESMAAVVGLPVYVEDTLIDEVTQTVIEDDGICGLRSTNDGVDDDKTEHDETISNHPSTTFNWRLPSQSSGESFLIEDNEEEASLLG